MGKKWGETSPYFIPELEKFPSYNGLGSRQIFMPKNHGKLLVPTCSSLLSFKVEQPVGWSPMLNMNLGQHAISASIPENERLDGPKMMGPGKGGLL